MTPPNSVYELPNPETITRAELDNGIVVLVYENHNARSVVVSGAVMAGSVREALEKNGTASLTANMLMLGTERYDFDALHSTLEDIGADLSFGGGRHGVGFGGKALAEDLPTLLDVLADALRRPLFPADEFERLRGETLTGLRYQESLTRYRAGRAFRKTLFPANHPYHLPTSGTTDSLPGLSVDDLRAFHQQHYGPREMVFTVVGAVNTAETLALVRQHFENWHNPAQSAEPELPAVLAPQTLIRQHDTLPGKSQTDIVMGALGPSRYDEDFVAASLANSVLGEFGMFGRVGHIIREQLGLAYYAYTSIDDTSRPGVWALSAGVAPQNVELAIDKAREQIRRLTSEPVSADELAENQSYFTGRLPLRLESNQGLASTLTRIERYNLGLDYLVRYHDMINSLTPDDLLLAAQRYLSPEALVVATAGPAPES